jgi:hypothetical protein
LFYQFQATETVRPAIDYIAVDDYLVRPPVYEVLKNHFQGGQVAMNVG